MTNSHNEMEAQYAATSATIRRRLALNPRVTPDTKSSEFVGPGNASTPRTSKRKIAWLTARMEDVSASLRFFWDDAGGRLH